MNLLEYAEKAAEGKEPYLKRRLPPDSRRPTIQERFEAFDQANPHIYAKLREFALQMKRSGRCRERYSMKALWERLRWHVMFEVEGDEEWRLNNDFTALYARKLMDEEAELKDFFETRRRRAA